MLISMLSWLTLFVQNTKPVLIIQEIPFNMWTDGLSLLKPV